MLKPTDLQDPDFLKVMEACALSTKISARSLFPDRFNLAFSALHDQIFDAIDGPYQQVAIAAPRGFGKSSIVNVAHPAKKILFREKKFIVPISCTASQAIMQAEDLKSELLKNENIGALFGPMRCSSQDETFSKERWVTETGTMVMPRGAGQQVRGIRFKGDRPDLIIVDDLEDPEGVLSEELRKKLLHWFYSDVCNSVDRSKDWKIIVIGTILHEDSLLERLLNDPAWHSIRLEICDDDYKSTWPDQISDEGVKKLADGFRAQGLLDVFYREYRNIPISKEDAIFRDEYFRYYDETSAEFQAEIKDLENIILVDPAKTLKLHSAHSAIVCIGFNRKNQRIYIRDIVAGMFYPDEIYDHIFDMVARFNAKVVGLEVTSLHEFITYPFRNEMIKRGKVFKLIELNARGKKEDRISMMVPFYRNGHVFHNKSNCDAMEEQLMTFPRCKRFDIIDACAYFIEMFAEGARFFDTETPDDAEDDEYKELREEEDLGTLPKFRSI